MAHKDDQYNDHQEQQNPFGNWFQFRVVGISGFCGFHGPFDIAAIS